MLENGLFFKGTLISLVDENTTISLVVELCRDEFLLGQAS